MTSQNPVTAHAQLDLLDLTSANTQIREFRLGDVVSGYQVLPAGQSSQLITGTIHHIGHRHLSLDTGDIHRATAVFGKAQQMELGESTP